MAWKANGEPVSGGFGPPDGVSVGGVCGDGRRAEGDVWVGSYASRRRDPSSTPTGRRPGNTFNIGKVRSAAGDRRRRELLHHRLQRWRSLEIQPDGRQPGPDRPATPTKPRTSRSTTRTATSTSLHGNGHVANSTSTTPRVRFVTQFGAAEGAYPGLRLPPKVLPSTKPPTPSTSQHGNPAGSTPSYGPGTSPFPT